jgi:hypothetical protein
LKPREKQKRLTSVIIRTTAGVNKCLREQTVKLKEKEIVNEEFYIACHSAKLFLAWNSSGLLEFIKKNFTDFFSALRNRRTISIDFVF